MSQTHTPFVPRAFEVPATLSTDRVHLRMLTIHDVVKDYDAVVTSTEHLKTIWPGGTWPAGLTLEQNLIDLGWHQKEFQRRRSFAYTVLTPDGARVVGCVYLLPTHKQGHDAEVYLWARECELATGLEQHLLAAVKTWVAEHWPFKAAAFPGRDVAWDAWNALPDGQAPPLQAG